MWKWLYIELGLTTASKTAASQFDHRMEVIYNSSDKDYDFGDGKTRQARIGEACSGGQTTESWTLVVCENDV